MNSNVEKLIQLIKENPELPVIPMVETEVVPDDCYSWWLAAFGKAEVSDFYVSDEKVYTDREELVCDIVENKYLDSEKSDEEIWQLAEKRANKLINKAIIVYIGVADK